MRKIQKKIQEGFTLIETMVAIALLMVALIAPMSLAAQSLTAAYYSRDQITAFYLAQEGIEIVRSVRDANIIAIAEGNTTLDPFTGIPYGTSASVAQLFTVDALQVNSGALDTCESGGCPPLQTNGSVYGYATSCEHDRHRPGADDRLSAPRTVGPTRPSPARSRRISSIAMTPTKCASR